MDIFSQRLKEQRDRLGLGHQEIAEYVGAGSRQQVAGWEAGGQPRDIAMLPKLAEALGVTTDWLLGMPEPEKTPLQGLKARHIRAAKTLATLPPDIEKSFLTLIWSSEVHVRGGILDTVINRGPRTERDDEVEGQIRDWQSHHHRDSEDT